MILRYLIATGFVLNIVFVVKSKPANNDDNEDSITTDDRLSDVSQKNFKHPTTSNRKWLTMEKNLPEKNIREIPVDVIYDLEVKNNINYEIRNVSKFPEIGNKSVKKVVKEFIATKNTEISSDKNEGNSNTEKNTFEKLLNEKEAQKGNEGKNSQLQNSFRLGKLNESNSEIITAEPETEKKENNAELNPIENKVNNYTEEIYDKIVQNKPDISSNVKREINKSKEFDNLDITEKMNKKPVENKEETEDFHLNTENNGNPEIKFDESQPNMEKEISNVSPDTLIENERNPIGDSKLNDVNIRKNEEKYFEKSTVNNQEKTQPSLDPNRIQDISNKNSFNLQEINSNSIISKLNSKKTSQNKFDNMPLSIDTKYNKQDKPTANNLDTREEDFENFDRSNQSTLVLIPSDVNRYKDPEKFYTFNNNVNTPVGYLERVNQYKIERIPSRDKIFQEKSDTYNKFHRPETYVNITNDDQEKSNPDIINNQDESMDKNSQIKIDKVSSHSNRYKYPEKSDSLGNFKFQEENLEKSTQDQYERLLYYMNKLKNQGKSNAANNTPNIQEEGVRKNSQYKIEKIPITKYSDLEKLNPFNNSNKQESDSREKVVQNKNEPISSNPNRYKNQEKNNALNGYKNQENNLEKIIRNNSDTFLTKNKVSQKSNLETLKESIKKHYLSPEVLHINTLEDDFQGNQMRNNNCVTHTIILNAPENLQSSTLHQQPSHSEQNAQKLNPQQAQPKPLQEQLHLSAQKLQISNQLPIENTVPTNQYPSYYDPYYPSHPVPNQFLFPNNNFIIPNWQNFDRRTPPLTNQPHLPYTPYFDDKFRPLNSIMNQPSLPYFKDVHNNYKDSMPYFKDAHNNYKDSMPYFKDVHNNYKDSMPYFKDAHNNYKDFSPLSPYYGNPPRKNYMTDVENPYNSVSSWSSIPPMPFFDRSYRNDETYPGSNYYGNNLAYRPNYHYGNQPYQPNYYNNPPMVPNNYETQGPYPHYAPPRASPFSNYFPIVVHDPVKQFYTYLHDLVQYGPEADVCKLLKKFKKPFISEKDKEDNVFEETKRHRSKVQRLDDTTEKDKEDNVFEEAKRHRNKVQRLDDTYENDGEENFSGGIDLLRLKPRKGIIRDVDRSSSLNRPLRGKRNQGRRRRRVLKRKYRNAPLKSNDTLIGSEVKDLNSPLSEEYKSNLPTLGRPRKKRNVVVTSDVTLDDELTSDLTSDDEITSDATSGYESDVKDLNLLLNKEYKNRPALGRSRKKRNVVSTSDVTLDDESTSDVTSDDEITSDAKSGDESDEKDLNSPLNKKYKNRPSLGRSRKKRNVVSTSGVTLDDESTSDVTSDDESTSDVTSDDESIVPSDQQTTKYSLAASDNSLTKIQNENPLPSNHELAINDESKIIRNSKSDSYDEDRQSRLIHQRTKSNSKNHVKAYHSDDEISSKGLGFNFKDHFKKDHALNLSDPNLHKVDIGPSIRKIKVKHGGVAIAGPGGIATAGSGGTAIVGPGGTAYTSPMPGSIAMVGPGGKVVPIPDPYHGFYRNSPLMAPPTTAPENVGMLSIVGPSGKTMQLTDGNQNLTETSRMFPQANTLLIPAGARLLTTGPIIYYNPVYPIRESRKTTNKKKR